MTRGPALPVCERAEIARSRNQAALSGAIRRTSPNIFRRYRNPQPGTGFPLEYLYHLVGDIKGKVVLDYGCGDGSDASLLADRGATVWALDISPDLLQRAVQRVHADRLGNKVRFLCGSAHHLPLADGSVDLVVGHAILHHLDLEQSSREVFRVLRPGGRALFQEPIRQSRLLRALRPLIPYRQPDISPYERPLVQSELDAFSRPFERLRSRHFTLPFVSAARLLRAPKVLNERAVALDAGLLAAFPPLGIYASVVVFELRKPATASPRS